MYKNYCVFKTALLDIRDEWIWYLFLMVIQPLSLLLFLKIIAGEVLNFDSYMVGSIVMTFSTGIFLSLGQMFSYYKATSSLDYYLSLPISKHVIILSLVFRNIILSLPSTAILIIIGILIYDVNVSVGIPFFIALILSSLSLAGVGTFVGVYSKSMQIASIITQVLSPIFIYLAPVFVLPNVLPKLCYYFSFLLPTTYSANALRNALNYNAFTCDFLILLFLTVFSLVFVSKKLDWRND